MEYYSAIKNRHYEFCMQMTEVENIILSKVTHALTYNVLTHKGMLTIKYRIPTLCSTDPKKTKKKVGPSKEA